MKPKLEQTTYTLHYNIFQITWDNGTSLPKLGITTQDLISTHTNKTPDKSVTLHYYVRQGRTFGVELTEEKEIK